MQVIRETSIDCKELSFLLPGASLRAIVNGGTPFMETALIEACRLVGLELDGEAGGSVYYTTEVRGQDKIDWAHLMVISR